MTLKKMSVAANDIVLNNLVMREKTFKTIPWPRGRVLLNTRFQGTAVPAPWLQLGVCVEGACASSPLPRWFPLDSSHGFQYLLRSPL